MIKGMILAGGKGTRLYPLTKTINKHLLPVGREPMIYNSLRNMAECGVHEVLVTTCNEHMGQIVNNLGSGASFGLDLTYKVQEAANGIADALRLGRNFVGCDNVFVLLADNVFQQSLNYFVENYRTKQSMQGARVLLVEISDPTQFGVAALDEQKVIEIQEKPQHPKSNYAVVGAYLYDQRVWDIVKKLEPSARGEYEITDVNNEYIRAGELEYDIYRGRWMDTGTFDSYILANNIMFES